MFYELMEKRGYMNLPEQAKRQMMAYPPSKKWVMVHQDKLADFQAEQKRRAATQAQGRDPDEDSPEWYVKKILDGTITAKQLGSLSVSLRTQPIRYVCVRESTEFEGKGEANDDMVKVGSKSLLKLRDKSPLRLSCVA